MTNVTQEIKFVVHGYKTLWGKEKMLVTSILSFSLNVFKVLLSQGHKIQELFQKGFKNKTTSHSLLKDDLTLYHTIPTFSNPGKEAI